MLANAELRATHLRRAFSGGDLKYMTRGGKFYAYSTGPYVNPDSPEQQLSRAAWKGACAAWRELPAKLKEEWKEYARENYRFFERDTIEGLTGNRLFQACAQYRLIMGLPIVTSAPVLRPPEKVLRLELLPSPDATTYRFRVHHKLGAGLRLFVAMTPATVAVSRAPEKKHKRHIKGWCADSTCELPDTGGIVEFSAARYPVQPGERFGVWVRVVREFDGLGRDEKMFDFIRKEFVAEGTGGLEGTIPNRPEETVENAIEGQSLASSQLSASTQPTSAFTMARPAPILESTLSRVSTQIAVLTTSAAPRSPPGG